MSTHNQLTQEAKAYKKAPVTKTADATLTLAELQLAKVLICNKSTAMTLTFPTAASPYNGMVRHVLNMGAGVATVAFTGASGSATRTVAQDETLWIGCDGSYWYAEAEASVTAVSSTTAAAFEVDSDGTVPALALGSQSGGTGNFTQTLKPPTTLSADQDILFQNAAGTVCLTSGTPDLTFTFDSDSTHTNIAVTAAASGASGSTLTLSPHATFASDYTVTFPDPGGADEVVYTDLVQTLAGKVLTAPTIGSMLNANHTHAATGATGGVLSSAGTNALAFEVDLDGSLPSIAIGVGTSGDFTQTIKPAATISGSDCDITVPNTAGSDDVIVLQGTTQTLVGKTLTTPTLTVPVIADFSSALHDHSSNATGGAITAEAFGTITISGETDVIADVNGDTLILSSADVTIDWTSNASTDTIDLSIIAVNGVDTWINSTNEMNIQIGGIPVLALDDDAISSNAGAADTAGAAFYAETQDGGVSATGKAGGLWNLKTGDGSDAGTGTNAAGAGGALSLTTGGGGSTATGTVALSGAINIVTGTGGERTGAGTAGASGGITLQSGIGGASGTSDAAGAAGLVKLQGGAGGVAAGTPGGAGGGVTLAGGAGGTAGGTQGAGGAISIDAGTGGTAGVINIGVTNSSATALGRVGANTTIAAAALSLESTSAMVLRIATVDILEIDDATIDLAAANSTAGNACYIGTEAGGLKATNTGQAGGLLSIVSGAGSDGASTGVGGAGGALTLTSGIGGDTATGAGGVSGVVTLSSGTGGGTTAATAHASGAVNISSGAGGLATSSGIGGAAGLIYLHGGTGGGATGDKGGAGAAITLLGGTGGTSSGTDGDGGTISIDAGDSSDTNGSINIGTTNSATTTIGIAASGTVQLQSLNLILDSKNPLTFQINAIDILEIDETTCAMTANAATDGNDCYIGTEGGGVEATNGQAGGLLSIVTGAGSTGTTTGKAGGAIAITTGAGGASAAGTPGLSGAMVISSGTGGAASGAHTSSASGGVTIATGTGGESGTSGTAAAAGTVALTGGVGGAATSTNTAGAGGAIAITGGVGGASSSGTNGLGGTVAINAGSGTTTNGNINIGTSNTAVTTIGIADAGSVQLQSLALILDSENPMVFQIGTVDILALDEAAITASAAADTAGKACYIGTEAGGTYTGAGKAGGLLNITTGIGIAGTTGGDAGGASGALALATGIGGDSATGTPGLSGAITLTTGVGGESTGAGTGGASGGITLTTGIGGASGTSGTAGAAGTVTLQGGAGGVAVGTPGGAGGAIAIAGGTGGAAGTTQGAGGAVGIDAGAGGTNGAITIGSTNAVSLAIGRASVTTTINGNCNISAVPEAVLADGDYVLFLDGGATSALAKEAFADVATLLAGTGITATSSVLSITTAGVTDAMLSSSLVKRPARKAWGAVYMTGVSVDEEILTIGGRTYGCDVAKDGVAGSTVDVELDNTTADEFVAKFATAINADAQTWNAVADTTNDILFIYAVTAGAAGNSITLAEAFTNGDVSAASLLDGADAAVAAIQTFRHTITTTEATGGATSAMRIDTGLSSIESVHLSWEDAGTITACTCPVAVSAGILTITEGAAWGNGDIMNITVVGTE